MTVKKLGEWLQQNRAEWDFSRCHPEQRRTCFFYEYYREPKLREYLRRPRVFRSVHDNETIECGDHRSDVPLDNIILDLYPEWPDKPYLSIKGDIRRQRLEQMMELWRTRHTPLRQVSNPYPGRFLVATFEIDQFDSVKNIKKAFQDWLEKVLPDAQKRARRISMEETRGRGAKVFRAALMDLGAARVKKLAAAASFPRIFEALQISESKDAALYSDHASAWSRAIRKVKHRQEDLLIELESRYEE